MKTAEEIIKAKTEGKLISDLESVMVECMEEYAAQFKKPNKPHLPKRWEDLKYVKGYYVSPISVVTFLDKEEDGELEDTDKNIYATKEQAEAAIALAQLSQLREVYRKGWKPDWNDNQQKYGIQIFCGDIEEAQTAWTNIFLSFQSPEIRDEFLKNFRDLIEKARPLMS